MNIILLEKVRNLGNLGDTVVVKPGYGRNFLLPQGKAIRATKNNVAQFEERRVDLEKKALDLLLQAQERAEKLNALAVKIAALTSDEGKLYGSIGPLEIATAVTSAGVEVFKREVTMPDGPLHSVGEYVVPVLVHSDVVAQVKVTIVSQK